MHITLILKKTNQHSTIFINHPAYMVRKINCVIIKYGKSSNISFISKYFHPQEQQKFLGKTYRIHPVEENIFDHFLYSWNTKRCNNKISHNKLQSVDFLLEYSLIKNKWCFLKKTPCILITNDAIVHYCSRGREL